jgi:hypothetical protein
MDAPSISTVAASVIAALAFAAGLWQFSKTQQATRSNLKLQADLLRHEQEAKAIDLFIQFSQLKREVADRALAPRDFWHHNAMVAVTESIHKIMRDDKEWSRTVIWMLKTQEPFLLSNPIDRSTFVPTFVEILRDAIPGVRWT